MLRSELTIVSLCSLTSAGSADKNPTWDRAKDKDKTESCGGGSECGVTRSATCLRCDLGKSSCEWVLTRWREHRRASCRSGRRPQPVPGPACRLEELSRGNQHPVRQHRRLHAEVRRFIPHPAHTSPYPSQPSQGYYTLSLSFKDKVTEDLEKRKLSMTT